MFFQNLLNKAESFPRRLFVIDGMGALLSAFFLGVVMPKMESFFGIPATVLYFLAVFPILFAFYDLFSYFQKINQIGYFLKGIATLNLLYCCLSFIVAIFHYETITFWGWAYLLFEVLIVVFLASIELNTANRLVAE
jgi:hypothetical protein